MDSKNLSEFKARLLKEQEDLVKQLKSMGEVPDMGSDTEGETYEEEADEAEEYSKNLGIKKTLKERLLDIKNALDKIAKGLPADGRGGYGKCENCGMEIEHEILSIDPESRYCKAHKK